MTTIAFCFWLILAVSTAYNVDREGKFHSKEVPFGGFTEPGADGEPVNERIIGGTDATEGAYPWQVSLQVIKNGVRRHMCGGSILSETKIACAAHCCDKQAKENLRIVAGAHNMQVDEDSQQIMNVSRYTVHPQYDRRTINNDACKIFLSEPLQLNDRVATIPLCTSEPTSGKCTATGWGTISTSETVLPTALQQVDLTIIPRATCKSNYAIINQVTNSMLCAGGKAGESGCNGDSGGPLVCTVNGNHCLAGATSWGMKPCAQKRYPTVYANVAQLNSFYKSN